MTNARTADAPLTHGTDAAGPRRSPRASPRRLPDAVATWTPRPTSRTRSTAGPGALASFVAAVVTIGVTAFVFLIAAAMLLPAPDGAGRPSAR